VTWSRIYARFVDSNFVRKVKMTCCQIGIILSPMEQIVFRVRDIRRFITAIATFCHRVKEFYTLKMDAVTSVKLH
jgi:hypothetical protein